MYEIALDLLILLGGVWLVALGLFAEAIDLHIILGAYLAGLFFEEKVAHPNLVRIVKDRAYGIAHGNAKTRGAHGRHRHVRTR